MLPFPAMVQAAVWHSAVELPMKVEYDSNPLLDATLDKSVTRTIIAPDFTLVGTYGLDELSFGAGVEAVRSSDTSVIANHEDPNLRLGWKRYNDKGSFGLDASYVESSTLSTAVQQTGVVTSDGTQKMYSLFGNWTRELDERNTLSNETGYRHVTYDVSDLTDYDEYVSSFTLDHAWSERLDLFGRFTARRYEPDQTSTTSPSGFSTSNSYDPQVGLKYQFSERLRASMYVGVNKDSSADGGPRGEGGVTVNYKGERFDASLDASRSSVASGEGGFSEIDVVQGTWSYDVDELSRIGFSASWQDSKGQTPNTLRQVGAWGTRDLSPFWSVRLSLSYNERQREGVQDADSKVVGVSLIYRFSNL